MLLLARCGRRLGGAAPRPSLALNLFRSHWTAAPTAPSLSRGTVSAPTASRALPHILAPARSQHTSSHPASSHPASSSSRSILGRSYPSDDYTNVPPSISTRIADSPVLPYKASHPLSLLRREIESHFAGFSALPAPSPVVTTELNFGSLGFPEDHPGRSPTDTYYLNRRTCLRTHTSAHEVETFAAGHSKWLLTADVYRRDEIDASHYPIFHQMEGASVWSLSDFETGGVVEKECEAMEQRLALSDVEIEDDVDIAEADGWQLYHTSDEKRKRAAELSLRHLKASLNGLALELFGDRHKADVAASKAKAGIPADASGDAAEAPQEPLRIRWIAATFPFTAPSLEVEVWFRGKWLEILGCGVVAQKTLDNAGVEGKVGWAFGLGLERIAMVLYSIPDIRLFWSQDPRFLTQFAGAEAALLKGDTAVSSAGGKGKSGGKGKQLVTFKPYSKYPPCFKDVSFWLPQQQSEKQQSSTTSATQGFHDNDLFEIVRDSASDLVEDVRLIDDFTHPKTGRRSKCYRVIYRSMDRSLSNEEVNALQGVVESRLVGELGVQIR